MYAVGQYIIVFLIWTLLIYWMHRVCHRVPILRHWHFDHHKQVKLEAVKGWHWSNIFLFNDTWLSTLDLWASEVIPTIIFCAVLDQWWLLIAYWFWGAFIQEAIEHNPKFDLYPWLTSGRWHLVHHHNPTKNFGVFFPVWDILFNTKMNHEQSSHSL